MKTECYIYFIKKYSNFSTCWGWLGLSPFPLFPLNITKSPHMFKSVVVNSATLFGNSAVRQHYSSATGPIGNGEVRQQDLSATVQFGNYNLAT